MPSILPQLVINGVIAGSIYALAASGLSLTYYVLKFLNFAQGAVITLSAYLFFWLSSSIGMNYAAAALVTVLLSVLFNLLVNFAIFSQLRKRKSTNVVLLISSLALLTFVTSFILAVFGSSTKTISLGDLNRSLDFGFFIITKLQIAIVAVCVLSFFAIWLTLRKTKFGKSIRALSDNLEVAQVVGINPQKLYAYTFAIAGILGSASGILTGLEHNLYPQMGIPIIIKGFISSVIGGIGSVPGSIIGGFFIGIAENIGIWFLPSGYKDVISFTILLGFLLFRPKGIIGGKARDDF